MVIHQDVRIVHTNRSPRVMLWEKPYAPHGEPDTRCFSHGFFDIQRRPDCGHPVETEQHVLFLDAPEGHIHIGRIRPQLRTVPSSSSCDHKTVDNVVCANLANGKRKSLNRGGFHRPYGWA